MDPALKTKALKCIFSWHEEWSRSLPLACRQGCSSCCTRSVTMTGLEGSVLLEYLEGEGRAAMLKGLPALAATDARPSATTNQFAAACLQGIEIGEPEDWNFVPCPFLLDSCCAIYPARPFGCRAFASLTRCSGAGAAEIPSLLLTVNTILLQIIEHLDQGGPWGNMLDVLARTSSTQTGTDSDPLPRLLTCRPCPGFLIPPEEQPAAEDILAGLLLEPVGNTTLGRLLGMGPEGQ